jgi:flagellar biosynthesis/type III secretory pathway protein FliH
MPQLRDFLSRLRPAGTPGAAARAGVPTDRFRELEAEVVPVLALLDSAQAECEQIAGQAKRDADDIVAAARSEAAAITADGGRRARAARDEAARQIMAAASDDCAAMVAAAERQAVRIRTLAAQRMPAMVSRAAGEIRELLAEGR